MFNKQIIFFSAIAALLFFLSSLSHANLIVNGSFEADDFGAQKLGLVGNDVTGWYIPESNGTYPWGVNNSTYGSNSPDGDQFFVLGYYGTGVEYSIQQTLTGLTNGATYSLSFAISSEQGCCSEAEVSFLTGSSTAAQVFSATTSGSYWTDWSTQTMNFLATSDTVTLQFKNINVSYNNGIDLGLDNVIVEEVASVPEPGSLALLGIALTGLGLMRRRKTT